MTDTQYEVREFEMDARKNRFGKTYSIWVSSEGGFLTAKTGRRRAWSTREMAEIGVSKLQKGNG